MLYVLWSIARDVKCAEAGRVLAELVAPKIIVGLILCDPVLVHVRAQVEGTEWLQESPDVRAIVRRDIRALWCPCGGVWRRVRIVLTFEVTILCVGAIAGSLVST